MIADAQEGPVCSLQNHWTPNAMHGVSSVAEETNRDYWWVPAILNPVLIAIEYGHVSVNHNHRTQTVAFPLETFCVSKVINNEQYYDTIRIYTQFITMIETLYI